MSNRRINYEAWSLKDVDLEATRSNEVLYRLCAYGILAPSAHNTQPWKVKISEDEIRIGLENNRLLESDTTGREAMLSIGAFVENIVKAAKSDGYEIKLSIKENSEYIVRGKLINSTHKKSGNWKRYIKSRTSNRSIYKSDPVSIDITKKMNKFRDNSVEVHCISDKDRIKAGAHIVANSSRKILNTQTFRDELSEHVHNNLTKCETGMPAHTQGIPLLPSLVAPTIIRHVKIGNSQSKKDCKKITGSPLLVMTTTAKDSPASWVRAGSAYEHVFLVAEKNGLSVDTYASAIEDPEGRMGLGKLLNTDKKIQTFVRVGFSKKHSKHTPRISSKRLLEGG